MATEHNARRRASLAVNRERARAMRQVYDEKRDAYLNSEGYRVQRFPNGYAADEIGIVLLTVKNALATATPSP